VTALITGADGFIGSNLAMKVSTDFWCDVDKTGMYNPKVALEILKSGAITKVYHLGAVSSTTETNLSKISYNNVQFSSELLDICIEKNIPFVYASSASVYGLGDLGFVEDSRLTPLNYYAISKACFDMFARQKMIDHPNAKIIGLRYFNVYGHNEDQKGDMASPVHKFLIQSKTGTIKIFEGSEDFRRDFIHVDDVVNITKAATEFTPGIYNVGTGISRTFLDVAKIISKMTDANIEEISFPEHLMGKYQDYTCSDNEEINHFYDRERISLEDGIRKVYEDRVC
jgi:ADP-L-glycero-D-manno-heptose 6-epimerase